MKFQNFVSFTFHITEILPGKHCLVKMVYVFIFRSYLLDVLIKTNILVLVVYRQCVFKTFSRRLQDVLRIHVQDMLQKRFREVLKTSSRLLQDVFKRNH